MSFATTALYAGLLGLMLIVLSSLVVRARRDTGVGVGTGGHESLERAIRVQANFTEYVPFALLLLLVAELNAANAIWLHANGLVLLVARIFHAWGLSHAGGRSFGRFWGTFLTWMIMILLALTNLYLVVAG